MNADLRLHDGLLSFASLYVLFREYSFTQVARNVTKLKLNTSLIVHVQISSSWDNQYKDLVLQTNKETYKIFKYLL